MTTKPVCFHEFEVFYDKRPPGLNRERNDHWTVRDEDVKEWKGVFKNQAIAIRTKHQRAFEYITVEVFVEHKTANVQDTGNCYPAVKAAIDGLVLARIIPDDEGQYVRELTFYPPEKTGRDRMTLRVRGWL